MLRMYLLQCWFNLSDEGVEDAIYDSYAMRKFVGIDFFEEDAPDATTLLKFRRLLEKNNLNKAFFEAINRVMVESGHIMRGGTIVDATIEQIDLFARGTNHRCYTHRGWDYSYQDDAENGDWVEKRWPKRKDILRETAEAVFNFNRLPRLLDGFVGYNERCEGFCKLVYYVHLLGDHIEFTTYTFNRAAGSELGHEQVIPLGASRGNSLISEIIEVFPVLFPEQDYSELERSLTAANLKVCSILNKPDDLKTDEGFQQYHEAAVEILEILHDYLPKLLRNEVFFNNVFYK